MFKKTFRERIRASLIRFGRKNRICYVLVMPLIFLSAVLFRLWDLLVSNQKKLLMCGMSLLFFTVFSSFSFPLFTGSQTVTGVIDFGEIDETVSLADESEVSLEEEEVSEEDELESPSDSVFTRETGDARELVSFTADEILQEHDFSASSSSRTEEVDVEDVSFDRDDWKLILVNKQHFIPDDYEVPLATIKGELKCDERILEDLLTMLSDAKDDGVSLYPCSPYRSHERQTYLFGRKITYYMGRGYSYMEAYKLGSQAVTIPDTSEHQLGLAVDIVSPTYTSLDEGFAKTDAGKWLAENCYRYGFILRYPEGKEYITTIEFEPWHFRYVGVEAATYMTRHGITLEEFWEEMF